MKIKYYLRGLGTGILITTLILFVAYSYRNTTNKEKDSDKGNIEQSDETPKSTSSQEVESSSDEESTTTKEASTEEASVGNETETTPPNSVEVEFTIFSGYSSYDVAKVLEAAGVIENAAEFDSYLAANGYDYRIATGDYKVKIGANFEEIAQMITRE